MASILMSEPGAVVELRALGVRKGQYRTNASGYFDDPAKLAAAAASIDGTAEGVYVTLNPILPELLARANNRLEFGAKHATADNDVVARRLLLIDLDPVRPSGISSTDEEKAAAFAVANQVKEHLRSFGFPDPIEADSGNGAHLLYRIELPTQDDGLVKRSLEALAFLFDTDMVSVDQAVHNPARICKLYGTLARKGDSTSDRPHRRSALVHVPEVLRPVSLERLRALADLEPGFSAVSPSRGGNPAPFDVETYLGEHHVEIKKSSPWRGGKRWILERCPFNSEHSDGAAFVVQLPNGAIGAGCHHSSCVGRKWAALRDAVEPGWREKQQTERSGAPKPKRSRRIRRDAAQYVPFPTDALPEPLRSFVVESCKSIGCDAAFVALPLLAVCAAAIGNACRIRLKQGWTEPSIIWAANLGDSGSKKSPAFDAAMETVKAMQAKFFQEHRQALDNYEREKVEYEKGLAKWRKEQGGDPPEKPQEPVARRLYCADTTVEALAPILQENWRGVLLSRDELAGWLRSFNQYKQGKGADTAHWLEMHGGRSMIVDRKSGPKKITYVPMASVSIAGGIQPQTLKRCLNREHFEDGLAARVLLAFPPRTVKQWNDVELSMELQAALGLVLQRLYDLKPARRPDGEPSPVLIDMTPKAKLAWIKFYNKHAAEQVDLSGDLSAAWSKLEAYAARFALITQLVRQANDEPGVGDLVDEASVAVAVELTRWFAQEAKRIYSILSESEDEEGVRQRAEMIERRGGCVTVRDWQRARGLDTASEAEEELEELVQEGLGGWTHPTPGPKGGRPTRRFTLAPSVPDTTPGPDDDTPPEEGANGVSSVSVASDVLRSESEVSSVAAQEDPGGSGDVTRHGEQVELRHSTDGRPHADTTDTDTTGLNGPPQPVTSASEGVLSDSPGAGWGEV